MTAAPKLPANVLALAVVSGPDAGLKFPLSGKRITIGRNAGNDIVLNDPKCSREHAAIEATPQGLVIRDLGSNLGITINGQTVKDGFIQPGSIIVIGTTTFQVGGLATKSAPSGASALPSPVGWVQAPQAEPPHRGINIVATDSKKPWALYAGVALVLGLIMFLGSGKKKSAVGPIAASKRVETEIELTTKRLDDLIRERQSQERDSVTYKDAEGAFIEGYRDYREGNFKRARDAFSAAASLNPNHKFAARYFTLAVQKLEKAVTESLLAGQRYTERNQYKQAQSAYRRVMFLLDDTNDKRYQEAKLKVEELEIILKGNF